MLPHLCKLQSLAELVLELCDEADDNADTQDIGLMSDKQAIITDSLMQLSALTALTSLRIHDPDGAGLNDAVAAAMAANLTRLQILDLTSDGLRTWSVVPLIAELTGLRYLRLQPAPCNSDVRLAAGEMAVGRFTGAHLMQLSSLTQLTELMLPLKHCSKEEVGQLLEALPSLEELYNFPFTGQNMAVRNV
jgi:hypothetical protein